MENNDMMGIIHKQLKKHVGHNIVINRHDSKLNEYNDVTLTLVCNDCNEDVIMSERMEKPSKIKIISEGYSFGNYDDIELARRVAKMLIREGEANKLFLQNVEVIETITREDVMNGRV